MYRVSKSRFTVVCTEKECYAFSIHTKKACLTVAFLTPKNGFTTVNWLLPAPWVWDCPQQAPAAGITEISTSSTRQKSLGPGDHCFRVYEQSQSSFSLWEHGARSLEVRFWHWNSWVWVQAQQLPVPDSLACNAGRLDKQMYWSSGSLGEQVDPRGKLFPLYFNKGKNCKEKRKVHQNLITQLFFLLAVRFLPALLA